jgi:hypothetical protein
MVSVEALKKRKINYFVPRIVLKIDKKKKTGTRTKTMTKQTLREMKETRQ